MGNYDHRVFLDSSIREQDRDIVCVFALLKIHRYGELIGAKDLPPRFWSLYFNPLHSC